MILVFSVKWALFLNPLTFVQVKLWSSVMHKSLIGSEVLHSDMDRFRHIWGIGCRTRHGNIYWSSSFLPLPVSLSILSLVSLWGSTLCFSLHTLAFSQATAPSLTLTQTHGIPLSLGNSSLTHTHTHKTHGIPLSLGNSSLTLWGSQGNSSSSHTFMWQQLSYTSCPEAQRQQLSPLSLGDSSYTLMRSWGWWWSDSFHWVTALSH